jgi:predicted nuclease with TOPRIM domain
MHEAEMIAQELNALERKLDAVEKRLAAVETANRQLEEAALTTARALAEISGHWDAVYEAMRRKDESQRSR